MFTAKSILLITAVNALLPQAKHKSSVAAICSNCTCVNENEFSFCTNCGYPLQKKLSANAYKKRIQHCKKLLIKAENAVLVARMVLYVMASFLLMGIFFIFAESSRKNVVVVMAMLFSALFFFLAVWSRKNPFAALLTAFVILIAFSATNIFRSVVASFTTLTGFTGMLICLALLLVILKGVQGAYRINLIKEELKFKI